MTAPSMSQSFRTARRAFTGVMIGLAALFPITSSFAQSVGSTTAPSAGSPACAAYTQDSSAAGFRKEMKCEIGQIDRRIKDVKRQGEEADRRGAEADQRGAEADIVTACTKFLISGVKGGVFTKSAVLVVAKGKLTAANACEAARSFGYGQKAELDRPTVH